MTGRPPIFADPRKFVSFDTETHRIQQGLLAPPLVVGSAAMLGPDGKIAGRLLDRTATRKLWRKLLADPTLIIVTANGAFDALVMLVDAARNVGDADELIRLTFDAYDAGRMFDIQLVEALHGIGVGMLGSDPRTGAQLLKPDGKPGWYSLDNVHKIRTGRNSAKQNDEYRDSYALLEDVPHELWPPEARQYPIDDACNTLEDALIQCGHLPTPPTPAYQGGCMNMHDLPAQAGAAWSLHLGAAWGFNVDPSAIAVLDERTKVAHAAGMPQFVEAGILRPDGSQDQARTKALVARAYGCTGVCSVCSGTGRVPSFGKNGKQTKAGKQCKLCSATGFDLSTASVPTTDGSRCDECEACEVKVPKGAKRPDCESRIPGVSYGRDALAESGDELLINYAAFDEDAKIQSTYLPWLRKGIAPDGRLIPLTLRPKALLETARVSYGDVVQLLPRNGGVRECIVPRPGYVFGSVDYEGGELVTHAQSCLWIVGYSKLAEALVAGVKVHDALGATMAGISYETMLAEAKRFKPFRQAAKPGNFMFPGGGGALKFALTQRKQGPDTTGPDGRVYKGLRFCLLIGGAKECGTVKVTKWGKPGYERSCAPICAECVKCAEVIKASWLQQWPENVDYFKHVAQASDQLGYMVQHLDGRIRGGIDYCSMANGYFQSLLAYVAKRALRRASRECYVRGPGETALYGSRIILFAHDEMVPEHPRSVAAEACTRLADIMVDEFKTACPDLASACKAAPTLMERWYKGAEPAYNADGRLIPWEPKAA